MDSDTLSLSEIGGYSLKLDNKKSVQQLGTVMIKRLHDGEANADIDDDVDSESGSSSGVGEASTSFHEILKRKIESNWEKAKQTEDLTKELATIATDFKFFEKHKKRSPLQPLCLRNSFFRCVVFNRNQLKASETFRFQELSFQSFALH